MAANSRPGVERAGDREKALETALIQIERQFGKGSVMRLGQEGHVPVEVIPTGSIALDVALGLGGLPRGRIVEIYGPESSGKCFTADTYVWTSRGLETIAEVFAHAGMKASCTSRVTDISEAGLRMVNERGDLEGVAALTHNNRKPVLRLQLRSGRTVSVTHNHPLRVISERGFIVWREAGQIQPGDTLVSALFGATEAAEGDGISEDEAVVLGYLVAEGTLSCDYSLRFTNWDPEVSGEFTRIMQGLFGVQVRNYYGKEFAVPGKSIRERFAREYGLDYVTAAGKKVPACVRTAGHKAQRAFLSALFEGDGWIDPSSTIGLGTASGGACPSGAASALWPGYSGDRLVQAQREIWPGLLDGDHKPVRRRAVPQGSWFPFRPPPGAGAEVLQGIPPGSAVRKYPAPRRAAPRPA